MTSCVKLANTAAQIKIVCHLTCKEFDFSADCSAVAHKAGNFDMFGSSRPVELAGHWQLFDTFQKTNTKYKFRNINTKYKYKIPKQIQNFDMFGSSRPVELAGHWQLFDTFQ